MASNWHKVNAHHLQTYDTPMGVANVGGTIWEVIVMTKDRGVDSATDDDGRCDFCGKERLLYECDTEFTDAYARLCACCVTVGGWRIVVDIPIRLDINNR